MILTSQIVSFYGGQFVCVYLDRTRDYTTIPMGKAFTYIFILIIKGGIWNGEESPSPQKSKSLKSALKTVIIIL